MSVIQEEIRQLLGPNALKFDWVKWSDVNSRPNKPQNVHHTIELPLEKLYLGMSVRIRADKKIPCTDCMKGLKKQTCVKCRGTGKFNHGVMITCLVCNGQGFSHISCNICDGNGNIQKEKYYTVKVPRGTRHGEQIRLQGEGDTLVTQPNAASDIVCTILEKSHNVFRRCGNDLYLRRDISVTEALCGLKLVITHLDGRKIALRTQPGVVIKTGDMKCAKNEGMPVMNSKTDSKGDLIILFNVLFPNKFEDVSVVEEIETFLPKRQKIDTVEKDLEEFHLSSFDPNEQIYHVPFRQKEMYNEESPAKRATGGKQQEKTPSCAQQ